MHSDSSYYTGVSNNLERRIWEHENGINPSCYTYRRRPIVLVFYETFQNVKNAIAFEKQLKGWSRKKKEALISGQLEKLPYLSLNYTQYGKPI